MVTTIRDEERGGDEEMKMTSTNCLEVHRRNSRGVEDETFGPSSGFVIVGLIVVVLVWTCTWNFAHDQMEKRRYTYGL